jgi:hypothetical protein
MAATLFVKAGAEYIRVATSVLNPDESGRAVGTVLGGAALDSIKAGKPYRLRVAGSTLFANALVPAPAEKHAHSPVTLDAQHCA